MFTLESDQLERREQGEQTSVPCSFVVQKAVTFWNIGVLQEC